ncbi:MAG: ArnT family glycosyltransferase [Candidatus Micrarchaeia archaeon]
MSEDFFDRYQKYLLLALIAFSAFMALAFLKGVSIYGDDVSYVTLVPQIISGTFKEFADIFSIRLLMIMPLAVSVFAFGYNNLGAGMYSVLCYLGSIAITFFIGRKIYGPKTGLLAAFLFSIYPMSLRYSSTADVVSPTAFYLGMSLLFFVYAKKGGSKWLYVFSGIFTFFGALVDPISYVCAFAFLIYIIFGGAFDVYKKRSLRIDYSPFMYLLGIITAVLLLGFVNLSLAPNGEPFYELNVTNSFYSSTGTANTIFYTNADLMFYVNGFFPYNFTGELIAGNIGGLASSLENLFSFYNFNANDVGLFMYFLVVFAVYIILKKDKESYFLLAFSALSLLYLEFGTMSLTHYYPIYRLVRFAVIVSIPLMILLARGIILFASKKKKKLFWELAAAAIIVLLLASSLPIDYFWYALNHNTMLYSELIAADLENAPNISNSYVYAPTLLNSFIGYYMGFRPTSGILFYNNGNYSGSFLPNCDSIPNGSYLIIPSKIALSEIDYNASWPVPNPWYINESWAFNPSLCNLTLYADIYNYTQVRNASIVNLEYSGNIYYKR